MKRHKGFQRLRSYKKHYEKHFIEKLKDPEFACDRLNSWLEESFETENLGIFQLVVKDLVEAYGGIDEIAKKMQVSPESLDKNLSYKGKAKLSTLISVIRACGFEFEWDEELYKKKKYSSDFFRIYF